MTAIDDKHAALGGDLGVLGRAVFLPFPPGVPQELPAGAGDGRFRDYANGSIYWSPATGAHEVHGLIRVRWRELGAEKGVLGYPITDETVAPDGRGRFNHFERGSIYWSPDTGAHEVHGAIRAKWSHLGWERSVLGYPITGELPTLDLVGRFNHFQHGSIYWSPTSDAHMVKGAIREKWSALGAERSVLGYPTGDETAMPDGSGWFSDFQFGTICCSKTRGTFEIHGAIRNRWAELGGIAGVLGYPISDETPIVPPLMPTIPAAEPGASSTFERGAIYWRPSLGAHAVQGPLYRAWTSGSAGPLPPLGYPIADEQGVAGTDDRFADFEDGVIYRRASSAEAVQLRPAAIAGASRTREEMQDAFNALIVPKLKAASERVHLPSGGGRLTPLTDYAPRAGRARNRLYPLRVDIEMLVEGTIDPKVELDLWIHIDRDATGRRIVASLERWHAHTTVGFPTILGVSPGEINAQLAAALDPLIGVENEVGVVPEGITLVSVKPQRSGDLDIFIAPLA